MIDKMTLTEGKGKYKIVITGTYWGSTGIQEISAESCPGYPDVVTLSYDGCKYVADGSRIKIIKKGRTPKKIRKNTKSNKYGRYRIIGKN